MPLDKPETPPRQPLRWFEDPDSPEEDQHTRAAAADAKERIRYSVGNPFERQPSAHAFGSPRPAAVALEMQMASTAGRAKDIMIDPEVAD